MPRETDEAGEQKVSKTGMPLGNRQFKIRTFYVAHRGEKRFMLATECARVLGYRDSYLLFNKNRSLHKIIASQQEKDELIHQEILPYSYRSRQIAIVTAKSMFRQFGARVIEGGRRVRDDYWEAKAIKQGFTEDDMAGDKRPGASKARDAAAALAENPPINPGNPESHQEIIYSDATMGNLNPSHGPPGILWPQINSEDSRLRAYGSVQRPRQGITGAPYQDRTQTTPVGDVLHQATNAAELNKTVAQQRGIRNKLQTDHWNRERESPVPTPRQKVDQSPIVTHSPHLPSSTIMNTGHQSMLQHQTSQMMSPQQAYSHQQSHQQNLPAQPPARGGIHTRSSISSYSSGHAPNPSPYSGYHHQQPPLWGHPPPHPQPQQSPLSAHHPGLPHYSPSTHHQQPPQVEHHPPQSPHSQPQQQQQQQQLQLQQQQHHPHHHQQQQEEGQPQQQPPQLPHNQSSGTMHAGITYQTMAGMPSGPSGYSQPGAMAGVRSMYPPHSGSPSHQQYLQQHQTTAAPQAGMQGWAPPQQQQQQQQGQQQGQQGWQQGYPASSAY